MDKRLLTKLLLIPALSLLIAVSLIMPASNVAAATKSYTENQTISGFSIDENTTLEIAEGKTLYVNGSITGPGYTLTITGGGQLVLTAERACAGITANVILEDGIADICGGGNTQSEKAASGIVGNVTVKENGLLIVRGGNSSGVDRAAVGIEGDALVEGGTLKVNGGVGNGRIGGQAVSGVVSYKGGFFEGISGASQNLSIGLGFNTQVLGQKPKTWLAAETETFDTVAAGTKLAPGVVVEVVNKENRNASDPWRAWDGSSLTSAGFSGVRFRELEDPYVISLDKVPNRLAINNGFAVGTAVVSLESNRYNAELTDSPNSAYYEGAKFVIKVNGQPAGTEAVIDTSDGNTWENGFDIPYVAGGSENLNLAFTGTGEKKLTVELVDGAGNLLAAARGGTVKVSEKHAHSDGKEFDAGLKQSDFPGDSYTFESGSYYLMEDIVCSEIKVHGKTVDLCLNGHIIQGSFDVRQNNGTQGVLNIYDCDNNSTPHEGFVYMEALWQPAPAADMGDDVPVAAETLYGGMIVGNSLLNGGGRCICVENNGRVNLYGGTIAGGCALQDSNHMEGGAGVYIGADSAFFMHGGLITENIAMPNPNAGSFDRGGSGGGGVWISQGGAFVMHGGSIRKNSAVAGGGVCVMKESTFVADGGTITENIAEYAGGGVYVSTGDSGADDSATCLAAGTPITLADGTRKPIEELTVNDTLRVFDHETGELSSASPLFVYKYPEPKDDAFVLSFSNGIKVTVVGGHCFFDKEAKKYVVLTVENADNFVGHKFYNADDAKWETLVDVEKLNEAVDTYIVVSEKQLNALANGMLSNVDGIYAALCNVFEMNSNLKIVPQKKLADIEKYGLWEYDSENSSVISQRAFEGQRLQYLGIALGKGLITREDLRTAIEQGSRYAKQMSGENGSVSAGRKKSSAIEANRGPVLRMLSSTQKEVPDDYGIYFGGSLEIVNNTAYEEGNNFFAYPVDDTDMPIVIGDGTDDTCCAIPFSMRIGVHICGDLNENEMHLLAVFANAYDIPYFFPDGEDRYIKWIPENTGTGMPACLAYARPGGSSGSPAVQNVSNGEDFYTSLSAAVSEAGPGDELRLLKDIDDLSEEIVLNKNIVIDLNGCVLNGEVSDSPLFRITDNAEVTIKDSRPGTEYWYEADSDCPGLFNLWGKVGESDPGYEYLPGDDVFTRIIADDSTGSISYVAVPGGVISGGRNGGIHVESGSLTFVGGSVIGNKKNGNGAGLYVSQSGSLTLGGNAKIIGNYSGTTESANNLYIDNVVSTLNKLNIKTGDDAPEKGMHVGVYLDSLSGYTRIDLANTFDDFHNCFESDNENLSIIDYQYSEGNGHTIQFRGHEHVWSYAGNGRVIKAVCEDTLGTCGVHDLTLSIIADDKIYNGSEQGAAFEEMSFAGGALPAVSYLKYDDASQTYSIPQSGTPKTVGKYKAYVSPDSGLTTAEVCYEIKQKEITVTITPNGGEYGDVTPAEAEFTGLVEGDSIIPVLTYTSGSGYNSTAVPTEIGSYKVTVSLPDDAADYILIGSNLSETFVIAQPNNYPINSFSDPYGNTVTADAAEAVRGTTITMVVTPAAGYHPVVGTLTVKDVSGNQVTVTDNTFIMPGKAVTIYAEFAKDNSGGGNGGGSNGGGSNDVPPVEQKKTAKLDETTRKTLEKTIKNFENSKLVGAENKAEEAQTASKASDGTYTVDGEKAANQFVKDGEKLVFTDEYGRAAADTMIASDEDVYYAKSDGTIAQKEVVKVDKKAGTLMIAQEDGTLLTKEGQVVKVGKHTYVTTDNGKVNRIGFYDVIDNVRKTYYSNKNGVVKKGLFKADNGKKYFSNNSGVVQKKKLVTAEDGVMYKTNKNGKIVTGKKFKIDGVTYRAGKKGKVKVVK